MEITNQQKNDFKKLSLLLNAMNMEDGDVIYGYDCYDSQWESLDGPRYKGNYVNIETPKSIIEIFENVRDGFDTSNFDNEYYDSETGNLYFDVNAEKKNINVTYYHSVMNSETSSIRRSFNELLTAPIPWDRPNVIEQYKILNNPEFIDEMYEKYGEDLEVTYDGGADSGWINDEVGSSKGNLEIDNRLENILYAFLESYYSGWEINDGSSGTIYLNFEKKEIHVSHTLNYQEDEEEEYMVINF
jgi:hypothetical protein